MEGLLSGVGVDVDDVYLRLKCEGWQVRSLVGEAERPGPAGAGPSSPLGAEMLILLGGAHRACKLLSGAGVWAGADDALHQRAHW